MTTNVAILGSGLFATNAYLPALLAPENSHINLHTIWSRSQTSAQKLADAAKEKSNGKVTPRLLYGEDGLKTVLADKEVEGVMLVLPITTQMEVVPKCLAAGKHVLSEKPIAKDVKSARALIEQYEKTYKPKGQIWRIAEDYDHEPILHKAASLVKDPALGPVLYWTATFHGFVVDGSAYQATEWRTIPDYQGGFLLDGGVHQAALIRVVLPNPPEQIISTASLHRNHIPPHDTIQALALTPSTTTDPHGPPTRLKGLREANDIPGGIGKSTSTGTIVYSFALPEIEQARKPETGLVIHCQHGTVMVIAAGPVWKLEVIPGKGTSVKAHSEEAKKLGVREECAYFARAIADTKAGKQLDQKEKRGEPRDAIWDVALIEAMLSSNTEKVDLQKLIAGK